MKSIGEGVGGVDKVVSGEVIEWKEVFLKNPSLVKDKIVYNKGSAPLYRMAFLIDNHVKAVLMEEGGKNYHPLILLSDAGVPAVAGIGEISLHRKDVTVDSGNGIIYEGEVEFKKEIKEVEIEIPELTTKVYVNVGYPTALESAAKSGADGIGLLRTEFTAVRTLSRILCDRDLKDKKFEFKGEKRTVKESIEMSNEADVIYAMAKDVALREELKKDLIETIKMAMEYFGKREIIVRTLDIARSENDPMGNRGIRRCVGEGGETIRILADAIKESLEEERGNYNIGVILPLVSHYSQIKTALDIFLDTGLRLKGESTQNKPQIMYGWEIEQPAASQSNELWLEAFKSEYGRPPDFIGIGTNDLTQFTIALGRDVYTNEEDLRYLFSIDIGLEDELNRGKISEKLKDVFETKGYSLSDNAIVMKEEEDKWIITDEEKFIVKRDDGKLNIYENYLENLYDEQDFSVIRQIYEVSTQCKKYREKYERPRLFLLGQAAAREKYAKLMFSFDIIPSVGVESVGKVKEYAYNFEKQENPKEEVIKKYIENLCDKQYPSVKSYIKPKILQILGVGH